MVNETSQGSHTLRKEKSRLQVRRFRVTYFEGPVERKRKREKEYSEVVGLRETERQEPEKEGSG